MKWDDSDTMMLIRTENVKALNILHVIYIYYIIYAIWIKNRSNLQDHIDCPNKIIALFFLIWNFILRSLYN